MKVVIRLGAGQAQICRMALEGKLQIICEKDRGISDAFNKGIKAATGDIVVILNSDDFYIIDDLFEIVASKFKAKSEFSFFSWGHGFLLIPLMGQILEELSIAL